MLRGGMTENNLVVRILAKDSPRLICLEKFMERGKWFATPIWHEYTNINAKKIAKKCLQLKDSNFPSRKFSNRGGWQSHDINLQDYEEFNELSKYINVSLSNIANEIDRRFKLKLDNAWININQKGSWNARHPHPNSTISGVFYASTDSNTGDLIFDSGSSSKHYKLNPYDSDMFLTNAVYKPIDGMLVFFPSWVEHEVTVNNSDKLRISIAFNAVQIY